MPNNVEFADIRWLVGYEAAALLTELAESQQPLHTAAARLRRTLSSTRTSLLLEQVELRKRAAAKFDRASQMFFTRTALEQATDQWTAEYKARRFAAYEAIADACCGIGGDLIALSQNLPVLGIDNSETVATLTEANLHVHGLEHSVVHCHVADAETIAGCEVWHADPDRRVGGKRSTHVEFHSPDGAALDAMLNRCSHAGVKLAPGGEAPSHWQATAELEWISRRGECRQQVAWLGELASQPGLRRATRLEPHGEVAGTILGKADQRLSSTSSLGEFLYEPDPAVLAAKLNGELANRYNLSCVASGIAYLTGDAKLDEPLLTGFRIQEVLPLRKKTIAEHLRARDVGPLEIKHRGVSLDPDRLRRELRLRGQQSATLIAFPQEGKPVAVVAQRLR